VCDWKKKKLDKRALLGADALIHLAGAGVADEAWTPQRKLEIIASRTQTLQFIYETWRDEGLQWPQTVLSASGMSYYGVQSSDALRTETDPPGHHFLSEVCRLWEDALMPFDREGVRTAVLRISIVLTAKGGALPAMSAPVKWGLGAPLGSGNQWMSWIHIDDLCRMFLHLIHHPELRGPFNAAAPQPLTHREFMKTLAGTLHRPLWPIRVPGFLLRRIMGERAALVLEGERISASKIAGTGFEFEFAELKAALQEIYG
jgi:uncharacterized protein (TIGR01777 family)